METPLQITFRDMDPSPAVETRLRAEVAKLERFYDRLTSCHVVVESPHRHQHKGRQFQVHLDIGVPGRTIAVGRDAPHGGDHEDVYAAIRDAFRAARRQVEEHARRARHEETPRPADAG